MSVEQTAPPQSARYPRTLSGPAYFGLMMGVCILFAAIGATSNEVGDERGRPGAVAVMAVGFVVMVGIAAAIARNLCNPTVPLLTSIFVGLMAAAVADAAGLNDSETWRRVAKFMVFILVAWGWATVVIPRVSRRVTSQPAAP